MQIQFYLFSYFCWAYCTSALPLGLHHHKELNNKYFLPEIPILLLHIQIHILQGGQGPFRAYSGSNFDSVDWICDRGAQDCNGICATAF